MTILFEEFVQPDAEQVEPLRTALKAFNESAIGEYGATTIMVAAHGDDGKLLGAVYGWLQFGWLYVNMLWVDDAQRRRRIGTTLLERIEAFAAARGVCRSRLATSDFQPGYALYRRRGYETYATIPIMPDEAGVDSHVEYLMWKHWSVDAPGAGRETGR